MKKIRVCLAWHNFDSANYGVGALAISHLAILLDEAEKAGVSLEIDTLGTDSFSNITIKNEIERRFDIRINHIGYGLKGIARSAAKFDFWFLNAFRKYDFVFDIGEGDSYTDIYGYKRFLLLHLTKVLANKDSSLIISPQTIGPFNNAVVESLAINLLKKADAVFVRDNKSSDYLKGFSVQHGHVSDVAFSLPFDKSDRIENAVGLNVSALLWNGGYSGNNQFGLAIDYQEFCKHLIEALIKRGKSVYLISHVISDELEVEDDWRVSCKLKNEHFKNNASVVIAPKFSSPIEAKSYISKMNFFVGSRMHATIAALSSGVVTIPIAYSRKFSGVFGSLGYNYTLDAYGETDESELLSRLLTLYDNHYDEMQQAGEIAVVKAKDMMNAYRALLKKIFS